MLVAFIVALICAVAIETVFLVFIFSKIIPFPDRGSTVLTCVSPMAKTAIVDILVEMGLSEPIGRADDELVERVIMDDLTVFNVTRPSLLEKLGRAGGARVYPVADPNGTALKFARLAKARGYTADIHAEVSDVGTPVVLVATNLFVNNLIGFRLPVRKMPKPKPY